MYQLAEHHAGNYGTAGSSMDDSITMSGIVIPMAKNRETFVTVPRPRKMQNSGSGEYLFLT